MTDRISVLTRDGVRALTVPESDDVWAAIRRYDLDHGTDLWDRLDERDVLGVNLPEYAGAPELDAEVME